MDQAQRAVQTESNEVLYDVADHIAVITLNAPERMNTISGPMLNDLTRLLVRANEDRDVRCVILTGNGRAFCAGLDLRKERSGDGLSAASSATSLDLRNTPPTVLQAMDKPTICAVNGGAAGYGMDTALGCDIRIMAESAKLAAAFVKRGVVPESGGTWFLPRMIGWAKASELIFTGRTLSAREALD
jgi:enoyl-CoA hydratase/carnithine racemase